MLAEQPDAHTGASHNPVGCSAGVRSTTVPESARIPGHRSVPSVDVMTDTASTRRFSLTARVLLPVALAVSTVTVAGPAHAVPDPGTPTSSTSGPARPGLVPASAAATDAAGDIARLRAGLNRLHGSGYQATIRFDDTHGISVQRGRFAGRVTEFG